MRLRRHNIPTPPNLHENVADLKKRKPEVRWAALVSWAGGWPTGQRLQDHRIPGRAQKCRLGCDAPDAWSHYAQCPRMQCIFAHAAHPRVEAGPPAAGFWGPGMAVAEREKLLRSLAARLHVYRTLRLGGVTLPCTRQRQGTALLAAVQNAAHKFKKCLGEKHGKNIAHASHIPQSAASRIPPPSSRITPDTRNARQMPNPRQIYTDARAAS